MRKFSERFRWSRRESNGGICSETHKTNETRKQKLQARSLSLQSQRLAGDDRHTGQHPEHGRSRKRCLDASAATRVLFVAKQAPVGMDGVHWPSRCLGLAGRTIIFIAGAERVFHHPVCMAIKLIDLHPRWAVGSQWKGPNDSLVFNQGNFWNRKGMGFSFDCPHCLVQRLGVWFSNPVDGQPPESDVPLWLRVGDSFETLTLTPSINTTENRIDCQGHWHGFVRDGNVISC